jgi:hypothetical protein
MHRAPDAISNAIGWAKFFSDAVIRVYDEAGDVIEKVSSRSLGQFHHRSNVRLTNVTKSASSASKG